MGDTLKLRPSVCFEVQKIISVSIGNGNLKNYQVQWAPTWVSGAYLVGCEHLVEDFLRQISKKDRHDDAMTPDVVNVDNLQTALQNDHRDVASSGGGGGGGAGGEVLELTGMQQSQEDIHVQVSPVDNEEQFFENDEVSISCLYSNTSNQCENVKMEPNEEPNMSNGEICTNEMDESNQINSHFERVQAIAEDTQSNEDTKEDHAGSLPFTCKNPCFDKNEAAEEDSPMCKNLLSDHNYTADNVDREGDGTLIDDHPESDNQFQNDILEVKREEIMLIELSDTDNTSFNENSENQDFNQTSINGNSENQTLSYYNVGQLRDESESQCNPTVDTQPPTTDEKLNKCNVCHKTFSTRGNLKNHLKLHAGVKPYQCPQCNKLFSHKFTLIKHFRVHSREKPFRCTQCNKDFTTKGNLKIHLRLHTGERSFKCVVCGNAFARKFTLMKHTRTHTGEKPYKCTEAECERAFSDKTTLIKHLRLHEEGEKK